MNEKISEISDKLENIEADALENTEMVTPLEYDVAAVEVPENIVEPSIEMSNCTCSGGCGTNYSYGNCTCSGNCGTNYHK